MAMRLQERYLYSVIVILIIVAIGTTIRQIWLRRGWNSDANELQYDTSLPITIVSENTSIAKTNGNCRTHSCLDIFKCNVNLDWKIKVYIYPERRYVDKNGKDLFPVMSSEYREILNAVKKSPMYTDDPSEACLFMLSSDTLSEIPLDSHLTSAAISSHSRWNDGQNHILFNMVSSGQQTEPNQGILALNTGKAAIAGADFFYNDFRRKFDISIPVFNTFTNRADREVNHIYNRRKRRLLTVLESYDGTQIGEILARHQENKLLMTLNNCEDVPFPESKSVRCHGDTEYDYPDVLQASVFCFIAPSLTLDKSILLDTMMMGCIPVIMADDTVLPFVEVLDWQRASVQINAVHLDQLPNILKKMTVEERVEKQLQAFHLWKRYFSTLEKITLTTFEIISDRIFITKAKQYEDWNDIIPYRRDARQGQRIFSPPLFLPLQPSSSKGFTAVILTYNRIQMLYTLMERLGSFKSLAKIIVVWNNVHMDPPPDSFWPKLNKPWVLIRQKTNRLSNRFFPYKEIETEAVLAIDDDILMLTADEVEFAFKTWSEFHDRLVGFPGRFHLTDPSGFPPHSNQMKFRYQSEWSNDISMVLTGAAFYHKVYNHWYTYLMPAAVRHYVDEKMNCEDIAMNFLIANLTRKAPIKVTARKRFKCSQCHGNESLWSESSHFVKRSECLSVFTELFGYMPLKTVEFRADPVLFQEDVPIYLKQFTDVGTI